ncbi:MAG TPA: LamG-like jellyroll fold domain-containing protein, partial [Armatimonadota bacterium]|nr:LamG-like jellyroll fold domain-containing protein [Armatimonadota bacterium]
MRSLTTIALLALGVSSHCQEDLVFFAPMDGTCEPVLGNPAVTLEMDSDLKAAPGVHDQAMGISGDCRYDLGGAFPVNAGTFAAWVSPFWRGTDDVVRTLLSVYGPGTRAESWRASRWTVVAGQGEARFFVYPGDGGKAATVAASIDGWLPDRWHHVAAVWDGLAGADGELMLYVDGELAGSVAGLDLAAD